MTTHASIPLFKGAGRFGQLGQFRRDPVDLLLRVSKRHPDIAQLRFGVFNALVLGSPELVHEVLVEKADAFTKSIALSIYSRPLLGLGLLALERDAHRKRRRLLAPTFTARRVADYADEIALRAGRCADRIAQQSQVNVADETMHVTFEIVLKTLFDAEISGDGQAVSTALPKAMAGILDALTSPIPLPPPIPTPANLRLARAVRELDEVVYRVIRERRAERQPENTRNDLLSLLLAARDQDDGTGLSDRELRDEAMTMMLAGHETTANALAWTVYALARAPEVRARVEAEVDAIREPQLAARHLPALPLTLQVVKEAMRLYPPVHVFGRRTTRAVDIGPYHVPAKTNLIINIVGIHQRADLYPDPERFDPERFSPEREKLLPKQAYLPFSAGPRICIGNHFAMMEAQLILATWLRLLRFELITPDQTVGYDALLTLRPAGGMPLRVSVRKPPPTAAETYTVSSSPQPG